MRRVDRLGDDVAKLLSMAAVIGRTFDLEVLSTIAEQREDDVLDVLEQAVTAALVTEVGELPGRFRFEHALIEHTRTPMSSPITASFLFRIDHVAVERRLIVSVPTWADRSPRVLHRVA